MFKLKKRIFEILFASSNDLSSRIFGIFIISLISLNVFAVILETVENLSLKYELFFISFEVFSIIIFTIEYLLRLWTCTVDKRFSNPLIGRIKFAMTPLAIVDLIAILPFYLPTILPIDLRFVRILRLLRLFRIFKVARYNDSFTIIEDVMKSKKQELTVAFFLLFVTLLFVSSLMYFLEHEAQPKAFASIPDAMWWGVVTMATIGYGDVVPITPLGKFFGGIIAILAIVFFALPAGVIISGFFEQTQNKKNVRKVCPHCGRKLD